MKFCSTDKQPTTVDKETPEKEKTKNSGQPAFPNGLKYTQSIVLSTI